MLKPTYFLALPSASAVVWRTRNSRGTLWISGVEYSWKESKSDSAYILKHTPGPVRPKNVWQEHHQMRHYLLSSILLVSLALIHWLIYSPALPFLCSALALLIQNSWSRFIFDWESYPISFTLETQEHTLIPDHGNNCFVFSRFFFPFGVKSTYFAGIYNKSDSVDCHRSLGNVGRDDTFPHTIRGHIENLSHTRFE